MHSNQIDFSKIQGYIFDVDGTLVLGDKLLNGYKALPGAVEVLQRLRLRNIPFVTFTNGSTKPPAQMVQDLAQVQIQVLPEQCLNPISVAISVFKAQGYQRLLVLGGYGVSQPLIDAGFDVICAPNLADDADAVLVGWAPDFGLPHLDAACRAVWQGASVYSVSNAPYFASQQGRTLGVSGAISAAIHSVTGKTATLVGKPSSYAMVLASQRLGLDPAQIAVVGDDLVLENQMARQAGAWSINVQTGISSSQDLSTLTDNEKPHLCLTSITQLLEYLK